MSQKPVLDAATRLAITKAHLQTIRIPKAPPPGFNPLEATPEELKSYGIPTKPDVTTEPQRYEAWSKRVSKARTFIPPQFTILENHRNSAVQNSSTPANDAATSSNWSGFVNTNPPAGPWTAVAGTWNVPNAALANPNPAGATQWVAVWVGIDGWGNGDVFQAGTDTTVSQGSGVNSFAWYEWYPANYVQLNNFPVSPGHEVYCEMQSLSGTTGTYNLQNQTLGTYTSFEISAPAGTAVKGISAEWIVEDPGPGAPFPNYGSVTFTNLWQMSGGTWSNPPSTTTALTLVKDGTTLSQPSNLTNNSFKTTYV